MDWLTRGLETIKTAGLRKTFLRTSELTGDIVRGENDFYSTPMGAEDTESELEPMLNQPSEVNPSVRSKVYPKMTKDPTVPGHRGGSVVQNSLWEMNRELVRVVGRQGKLLLFENTKRDQSLCPIEDFEESVRCAYKGKSIDEVNRFYRKANNEQVEALEEGLKEGNEYQQEALFTEVLGKKAHNPQVQDWWSRMAPDSKQYIADDLMYGSPELAGMNYDDMNPMDQEKLEKIFNNSNPSYASRKKRNYRPGQIDSDPSKDPHSFSRMRELDAEKEKESASSQSVTQEMTHVPFGRVSRPKDELEEDMDESQNDRLKILGKALRESKKQKIQMKGLKEAKLLKEKGFDREARLVLGAVKSLV